MTDTTAPAETHDGVNPTTTSVLTPYHGTPVVAAGVAIANAAGGLHDAVAVDPVELEIGSTVHVVLRCVVRPPQYDPVDKDNLRGPLKLVNRLRAEDATFVEGDLVKDHLAAQRERIEQAQSIEERRKREEAGEVPLFDDEDEERGGEPASAADVFGSALSLVEDAETDGDAADARRAELAELTKPALIGEADAMEIVGRSGMTKTELVDAIVDAELAGGDA